MAQSAETKRWIVIYPAYLDSTKKVAEGRRVATTLAVPKPTLAEISACLRKLGYTFAEEPEKAYSRDPCFEIGRVRVQFRDGESPVNPEITNST